MVDLCSQPCGSDPEEPMPECPSSKDFERVVNLSMRNYNSVLMIFDIAPDTYTTH